MTDKDLIESMKAYTKDNKTSTLLPSEMYMLAGTWYDSKYMLWEHRAPIIDYTYYRVSKAFKETDDEYVDLSVKDFMENVYPPFLEFKERKFLWFTFFVENKNWNNKITKLSNTKAINCIKELELVLSNHHISCSLKDDDGIRIFLKRSNNA